MPHLHLMTSADVAENADLPDILHALVDCLCGFETVNSAYVKAYHTLISNWVNGEGAQPGFAHLEVKLLSGRDEALRNRMADALFRVMEERLATSIGEEMLQASVEVHEMNVTTYRKH